MRNRLAISILLFVAVAASPTEAQDRLQILGQDPVVVQAFTREGAIVTYDVPLWDPMETNPVVRCEPPSGALFPLGPSNVFCVATNDFGDRAEGGLYVFVYDGQSPVLTVPDRIKVKPESSEGTVVRFEVTAEDAIDGRVEVECAPPSGSRFPIGITRVDCVAYDLSLNPGYGSFEVEVEDENGHGTLVLLVPEDMDVEATSGAGAEVHFTVTATGSDDPNPEITCDPPGGATFPLGSTTVRCVATDSFGDRAEGQFEVNVLDTTKPVLTLTDVTAEASGGFAVVTFAPTAVDAVDGPVPVTCTPPSGSEFPLGESTVECSASDSRGLTATGFFIVRVVDTTPPNITSLSATPGELSPPNHKLVDVTVTAEAADANDATPQCMVWAVTGNQALDGPADAEPDWIITSPLTLQLRAERDGGSDRVYNVHVRCSDDFGNGSIGLVAVTVPHGNTSSGSSGTAPPPQPTPTKRRAVGKR